MKDGNVIDLPASQELATRQEFATKLEKVVSSKRTLFALGSVAVLAIILPLAVAALKAGLALIAIGFLALMGVAAWKMIPRWLLTIENRERELIQQEMNRHLAALKKEAKQNPIEQAQNEYLRRSAQYEAFKAAMGIIGGKVQSFRSKLAQTKRDKPAYDLSQETAALERMTQFYTNRMERLQTAFVKLGQFKEKIEEANTKWEFQLAANDAIRAMNATDKDAKINEILTAVAFDSVQQEFDSVFAKLDVDAAELNASKALEFGQGMTIDVSAIHIDQPELVPAQLIKKG
jgi:hypothetical protein